MSASRDELKQRAARKAALFLDGVRVLGLGTGTTAAAFIDTVGDMVRSGELAEMVAVPTSEATAAQARRCGIPLTDLDTQPCIDVTVDGADEVSRDLDLIKGLGGALAREKIVAAASKELIIITDDSKLVNHLGEKAPLPVEVLPFGWKPVLHGLRRLGAEGRLRMNGDAVARTDQRQLHLWIAAFRRGSPTLRVRHRRSTACPEWWRTVSFSAWRSASSSPARAARGCWNAVS